ncbi:MAG: hypothetical protein HY842_18225 [Bacteroidetes bacterium]|nr:hypothetical protein [Bacteroidota bacterium]
MKKNLFLSFFFILSIATFVKAQSQLAHTEVPIDSRLFEAFGGDYLENLKTANPFLLQRWNFYLDNSWYLTDFPTEKDRPDYATIRIDDLENINILVLEKKFGMKRDWNKIAIFKIENTDKALVLISGKAFNEKLNEHLKR